MTGLNRTRALGLDVPEDWSLADEPNEDQIEHDLFELTCRLYDGDGQPTAECWCWSMTGRYTEHQVNVHNGPDDSLPSKSALGQHESAAQTITRRG